MESAIYDRIRALRKKLGLSQTDFAASLGCGRGTVRGVEEGLTEIKPELLGLIIRSYHVNPQWLETGEGEMFRAMSRREEIADFVGKTLADDSGTLTAEFTLKLVAVLAKLDAECWQKLAEVALAIKEAEDEYDAETKKEGG